MIGARDDDHLVLFGAPEEFFATALAHSLEENVRLTSYPSLVGFERKLILKLNHLIETANLGLFGDVIVEIAEGISAWALRIFEHKGRVIAHFTHEREAELVVFLCFSTISGKDVGGDGTVFDDVVDGFHAVHVPLAVIFAIHLLQNDIATALHRQVDVATHIGFFGNHTKCGIAHVFGVGCGEADAHIGHRTRHSAQKFGEEHVVLVVVRFSFRRLYALCGNGFVARLCFKFLQFAVGTFGVARSIALRFVGIDILSQKGHFFETTFLQVQALVDDALHISATLATTGVRHDAEVAEVVATTGDAHKTRNLRSAEAFGHDVAISLREREINVDGFLSHLGLRDEVGQREIGIGSCHNVGMVLLEQIVFHTLCHATENSKDEAASLLAQSVEGLQTVDNLLLGIIAH